MDPRTTTVKQMGVKRRLGRMLRLRPVSDEIWDRLRLAIDLRSDPVYQPLTWIGRDGNAGRAQGVVTRWQAMLPLIDELNVTSAVDLGCNAGWYVLELAARGIPTIGIERHPPYYRTALNAVRRSNLQNAGIQIMTISPQTIDLIPETDCTLFLALWHHLVRSYGLDAASTMLETIWSKTRKLLVFETGENEMPAEYGLPPLTPDAKTWLTDYLLRHCHNATLTHLGQHHGGDGGDTVTYRNLFGIIRTA